MKTYRVLELILVMALLTSAFLPVRSVRAQAPTPPAPPAEPKTQRSARPEFAAAITVGADGGAPAGTAAPPSNDDFDNALEIAGLPYGGSLDTGEATLAPDDPVMGCGSGTNNATVWYRLTPTVPGEVEAHTLGSD
jgi:hypothetical protein